MAKARRTRKDFTERTIFKLRLEEPVIQKGSERRKSF